MISSSFNILNKIHVSKPLPGVRLFAYTIDTPGVVTILGSFLGGDTYAPDHKGLLPDMVASLLDTGTAKLSKAQLRDKLESLGASLAITARGDRMAFSIQCMPEDMQAVLAIVSEELRGAIFPESELKILKHHIASALHEEKSETSAIAMTHFLQSIYPKGHSNYQESIAERLASLPKISRKDLLAFHKEHFGRNDFLLCAVGDVNPSSFESLVKKYVKPLPETTSAIPVRPAVPQSKAHREFTLIKDKATADVVLGHELPITRKDLRYYPLLIVMELLGASGFTSHLFQTVRERDGLTYFIRAGLAGFGDSDQGHWFIRSTFAPHLFQRGLSTILSELDVFLKTPIADEVIEKKKEELIGAFAVSLGTTAGLAKTILWTQEEGLPLSFIDEYPTILRSITPASVREALSLIHPKRLTICAAGSIDANGKPL